MEVYEYISRGGPILWIILFCSIVVTFIFLEKWFLFHREQIDVGDLVKGLINVLKRDGYVEAITLCDNTPGPIAHILMAAIKSYKDGESNIKQSIEDAALIEIPRLEKHLNVMATVAYITPLLGLLGTVIGMMGAFRDINMKGGMINASDLSGNIELALITTAAGLCVAIPSYVGYNFLLSRVESFVLEMEKASSEIIYFFNNRKNKEKSDVISEID
jgi:biopolymer transport protein ExbB